MCRLLYTRGRAGGFFPNRRVVAGHWPTCVFWRATAAEAFPQTDGRALPPVSFRQVARPDKDMAVPVHPSVHRSTFYGRTDADVQPTHGKNTGGGRARVLSCRAGELQLARRIGCSSGLRKCH